MATAPEPASRHHAVARPAPSPLPAEARRPFRDNPRLILLALALLVAGLVAMVWVANRSAEFAPDFLTEVVLYALSAADLTMLVALGFVLARNIIKLIVERRRGLPFARFRAKVVAMLLGMTFIPAVLVLIVGSELIRNSADRWFSAPVDEVLTSANQIASDYYHERQLEVSGSAGRLARTLGAANLSATDGTPIRKLIDAEVTQHRVDLVEVYRLTRQEGRPPALTPIVNASTPSLPSGYDRASAARLAAKALSSNAEARSIERVPRTRGELVRAATVVRSAPGAAPSAVVVASQYLTGELAAHARRVSSAYEDYQQLRVLNRPLQGVYLSFFLMWTLMILVSATWLGPYLAKRITRPVLRLADAAREIGAGRLDHRVERETADELGTLVDAFNAMASELAVSRQNLERSRIDLERTNLEVEARRRYIETILERIATGVVSIDAAGRISTINTAAARLLGLDRSAIGTAAADALSRPDLQPVRAVLRASPGAAEKPAQEIALAQDGREVHLAVASTALQADRSGPGGTVLVVDDVTPLIRAQRVAAWRDVARRLAHEIKNPLTPIQLCAERLRRHFSAAPSPARELVEECTDTIVGEVEALKSLVDEFAQFARMPAPRTVPSDLHELLNETLALYDGLFHDITIDRHYGPEVPHVRVDPEQIRRVVINLVDNAVEALRDGRGAGSNGHRITLETAHDAPNHVVRVVVADNGPGIPASDRDKLFMPYYSTKRRGSGLGLAIVRRIVAEHGGSIEVGDNAPHGTRFTIELPC
jgi:two-component system nitrogen regulation sensor histidine kinase NtrY